MATPIPERITQNMMERAKIDQGLFKFKEFGSIGKETGASLLTAAMESARSAGAEVEGNGVFVSSSPAMLKSAGVVGLKTVAVTNGQDGRFEGMALDVRIKSLSGVKRAAQKVSL